MDNGFCCGYPQEWFKVREKRTSSDYGKLTALLIQYNHDCREAACCVRATRTNQPNARRASRQAALLHL